MKTFIIALVLSLATGAYAQTIWCAGESVKVKAGDEPRQSSLTWDGNSKTATLGSARNEYVGLQIITRSGGDDLKSVSVEASDLAGPDGAVIPKANIDLFVEHYLNVTISSRGDAEHLNPACTPGETPTQMVPLNAKKFGSPFDIGAGRNQPVWADIYVPEDAKPGNYTGTFKVKSGDNALGDVKVALTVWNFTLPNETHFRTYLYTGPENLRWAHHMSGDMSTPEWNTLVDQYFQMAHQHRLNFNITGGTGLEEVLDTYYKYYDGSGFTQRVGKGVGMNVACITPEGNNEADFKALAKEIVERWERKSPSALLVAYIWDEPHTPEDFATSKQRAKWVHEAVGKKINTFIATPQYEKYDPGDVNIFSEPSIEDIPKIIARGDTVWAVNGGYAAGPYVDSPGYGGRSIVWMNWKMNTGGWQFWDCCYWVDTQNRKHKVGRRWVKDMTTAEINADPGKYLTDLWNDPLDFDESRKKGYPISDSIRINGDGILFYPGHDIGIEGPIASFAMKSLRRGAQDYEYLWMLKQQGKEAQIQPIVDSVCPEAGKWNDDPEAWDKARLELAKLLNKP